jgi:hypothetical protein
MAMLLARRGAVSAAVRILDQRLSGAVIPGRALRLLAEWIRASAETSEILLRFVQDFPFDRFPDELPALLRDILRREDFFTLGSLLRIAPELHATAQNYSLRNIGLELDALPQFADVPMIGATLMEMKRVQIFRKLSALLGVDPADSTDPMPRFIRLVPISADACEEWAALKAARDKH